MDQLSDVAPAMQQTATSASAVRPRRTAMDAHAAQCIGQDVGADELERNVDAVRGDGAHLGLDLAIVDHDMVDARVAQGPSAALRASRRDDGEGRAWPLAEPSDEDAEGRGASSISVVRGIDAPPRIRIVCLGLKSRPVVRQPIAVWNVSGSAPSVDQSSDEEKGLIMCVGTIAYSA